MPCFHPMPAVRMNDGSVKFVSRNKRGVESTLELPCGQCIGCRLERSRQWAMRCLHESSMHENNAFITLTYDESKIPPGGSLHYPDFQLFLKRLRKHAKCKLSFYVGGEYGETTHRPHYHACIFGFDFSDKQYFSKSSDGSRLFTSDTLNRLWGHGHCLIGNVTFASAAYIARYCVAKVNGQLSKQHYEHITDDGEIINRAPEFNHMSLKPALGKLWLAKYRTDVYPRDYVIINGVKTKPPAYYDKIFEKENPGEYSEIVAQREYDMSFFRHDNTYERLAVKHTVKLAQSSQLRRSL